MAPVPGLILPSAQYLKLKQLKAPQQNPVGKTAPPHRLLPPDSPSPRVCLSKSCLACSLVMRLLPFTYSLNFCKTQGTRTLEIAGPRPTICCGMDLWGGEVKGRSCHPQGPQHGERGASAAAPSLCSIRSPAPLSVAAQTYEGSRHPRSVLGTQRKLRGNGSSERRFDR